jgi:hypothetical protein
MTEYGVFAVDRGVFDHPLLATGEPYSRREAWLWLVAEAAWKPRQINRHGTVIELQRGQLAHSIRFMADAWGWSKSSVDRFLTRLKTGTMIGTDGGTASLVITICNYDAYQRIGLPERDSERDADRDTTGTPAGQTRNIQTFKEDILSETLGVSDTSPPKQKKGRHSYPVDYDAAWKAYPTSPNMSKAEGLKDWMKLSVEDRALVLPSIAGYRAYLATKRDLEVIHFCRYLSKRRFEGFTEAGAADVGVEVWKTRLAHARANRIWSTAEWGPIPGQAGCTIPRELLEQGDGVGWAEFKQARSA